LKKARRKGWSKDSMDPRETYTSTFRQNRVIGGRGREKVISKEKKHRPQVKMRRTGAILGFSVVILGVSQPPKGRKNVSSKEKSPRFLTGRKE